MRGKDWSELSEGQWDEKAARRVLAAVRRSGMSLAEFARTYGVTPQRLSWWRRRLERRARSPRAEPAARVTFIPAQLRPSPALCVRLPGEVVLEVGDPAMVSASWVASLARELSRRT